MQRKWANLFSIQHPFVALPLRRGGQTGSTLFQPVGHSSGLGEDQTRQRLSLTGQEGSEIWFVLGLTGQIARSQTETGSENGEGGGWLDGIHFLDRDSGFQQGASGDGFSVDGTVGLKTFMVVLELHVGLLGLVERA